MGNTIGNILIAKAGGKCILNNRNKIAIATKSKSETNIKLGICNTAKTPIIAAKDKTHNCLINVLGVILGK